MTTNRIFNHTPATSARRQYREPAPADALPKVSFWLTPDPAKSWTAQCADRFRTLAQQADKGALVNWTDS